MSTQLESPFPQMLAGGRLTANMMNSRHIHVVYQETEQVVNNSTVLVDSEITFDLEPNAVYEYTLYISYSADAAADFVVAWKTTPGVTPARFTWAVNRDNGGLNVTGPSIMRRPATTTRMVLGGSGVDNFHFGLDQGTFITPPGGGTATLQFAQDSADTSDATLRGTSLSGTSHTSCVYSRIA